MDAGHWLLLVVIFIGLIAFIVLPMPDEEITDDNRNEMHLKRLILVLSGLAISASIGLYSKTLEARVKEPSKGFGDTPVDWLLDEIKADDKATYTKVEVLNLVYKYLREYTREGKYEERTIMGRNEDGHEDVRTSRDG